MTTLHPEAVQCALCGQVSEQCILSRTNAFGSPDLDLRPPEMQRRTMHCWVQACPHCGYCAGEISVPFNGSSALVKSEPYRARLKNRGFPELANRFLCQALVIVNARAHKEAGWACLHAAWACDDAQNRAAAIECRKRALENFRPALARGDTIVEPDGAGALLIIDLLRRSEQFDEATRVVASALSGEKDETLLKCLQLEEKLVRQRDTVSHEVSEAFGQA